MTVEEIITALSCMPPEVEVFIEAQSRDETFDKLVTGVDWNVAGRKEWVTISDYKGKGPVNQ